jgi:hypothetical protein
LSDQKPHITASELDHILEQVQKKRADAPAAARPAQSSDADLDAILSELGVGTGKKRAPVEPILLPVPEFAHEKNDPLPEIPQPAPEKAPEPAAEPEPEPAPVEDEVPTVELPDIKAYSEAEAQKQAEERARIMEEARREAENTLHSAAGEAVLSAAREAVLRRGSQPAQEQEQAAPVTGNNLFGEVDDRFRDFFATAVRWVRAAAVKKKRAASGRSCLPKKKKRNSRMSLPRARQASTMRPLWRRAIPGNLTPSAPSSAFRARPCRAGRMRRSRARPEPMGALSAARWIWTCPR